MSVRGEQMRGFWRRVLLQGAIILVSGCGSALYALDLGSPHLSEPRQQEQFFSPQRFSVTGNSSTDVPLLEPQLSFTHDVREDDVKPGLHQTTHRISGEAGGRLNLGGDLTVSAVAKIPVFTREVSGGLINQDEMSGNAWLKDAGRFSWRSEVGIPLGEGIKLNFFYDRSAVSNINRYGVDEKDERFGTNFILRFK